MIGLVLDIVMFLIYLITVTLARACVRARAQLGSVLLLLLEQDQVCVQERSLQRAWMPHGMRLRLLEIKRSESNTSMKKNHTRFHFQFECA